MTASPAGIYPAATARAQRLPIRAAFGLVVGLVLCAASACGRSPDATPAGSGTATASASAGSALVDESDNSDLAVLDHVGATRGWTYAVDAEGTRAVFGRGSEVVVLDVADPSRPVELRTIPLSGEVRDLALAWPLAAAAADTAGLQLIDLEQGNVVGAVRFGDRAHGVDVSGPHVYVAARSQGLRVVDVTEPGAPREIGGVVTADEAVDVVVRGDFAYVAGWYESMRVIDVSDPAEPADVSFAPFDSYDHGAVWGVAVDGEVGLAAIPEKGLRAVNLANPREVTNHAVYRRLHAPAGVALAGRTAYVADQEAGLRVLDLSEPSAPEEIGSVVLAGRPLAVVVAGSTAFVAAGPAGLRLVDVSAPNNPREIAFVDHDDEVVDVVANGRTILVAGAENGVYRYARRSEGRGLERVLDGRVRRLAIDGARLVAAGVDGTAIYEEDRLVAQVDGEAHGAAIQGGWLASAGPEGIRFFDVTAPGTAVEAGRVAAEWNRAVGNLHRTPPVAWDVALDITVKHRRAFAAFDDGIYEIDLSSPGRPAVSGFLKTPERPYRLVLAGDTLFAACDDGLRIVDVSGAAQLHQIVHVRTPSFATALLVDGNTVFVGDLSGHVTAVRVADGRIAGTWQVADRVRALARTEEGLAIAAGPQGLLVVMLPSGSSAAASL